VKGKTNHAAAWFQLEPHTVNEDEIVYIIEYSGDELDRVKVLSPFFGGRKNNLKLEDGGLKIPIPKPGKMILRRFGEGMVKSLKRS